RMHEHALDLRGLIGAAHPARKAYIGAAARRGAEQDRGEVPGCEPDHGVVLIERSDHDFADLTDGYGIAGARPHDLNQQPLVDDHAVARLALVGDDAEVRGRVALAYGNSAASQLLAQRSRQSRAGDEPALERGDILAGLGGGIEQYFQKIGRADVSARL